MCEGYVVKGKGREESLMRGWEVKYEQCANEYLKEGEYIIVLMFQLIIEQER